MVEGVKNAGDDCGLGFCECIPEVTILVAELKGYRGEDVGTCDKHLALTDPVKRLVGWVSWGLESKTQGIMHLSRISSRQRNCIAAIMIA